MQLSIHILCKFPNYTTGLNCPLGREGQNVARCVNVGKTEKLVLIGQEKMHGNSDIFGFRTGT